MSEAQIQTFLGEPTSSPDGTSPESELDSGCGSHTISMVEPQPNDLSFLSSEDEDHHKKIIYCDCRPFYSMNVPVPEKSIEFYLNPTFLRNYIRGCNCEHGSWFFDKNRNKHNCGHPYNGYCKGLIIKPYVKCKIINQNEKSYLRLEFNFEFENFSKNPDFDREIEEYNRMSKIILVEIHDYRIIEHGSLNLLFNNLILAEINDDVEENKVGETRISVEYEIKNRDGTVVKCSLPILSINYVDAFGGSSFPSPLGVEIIFPSQKN